MSEADDLLRASHEEFSEAEYVHQEAPQAHKETPWEDVAMPPEQAKAFIEALKGMTFTTEQSPVAENEFRNEFLDAL